MAACRSEMTLTPDMVAASCLVVAEVDARVTGMAQLIVRNSVAELDKLFVEPDRQADVVRALDGLIHVPFQFDTAGSQIIFYEPGTDYLEAERLREQQPVVAFRELACLAQTAEAA